MPKRDRLGHVVKVPGMLIHLLNELNKNLTSIFVFAEQGQHLLVQQPQEAEGVRPSQPTYAPQCPPCRLAKRHVSLTSFADRVI